jgi:hypothetical protein
MSRSVTIWVAIPAWSVPGCQSVSMPAHAVPAGQDILQRVVEGVAHVQRAGHVRRRDHHAKGLGAGLGIGPGAEGLGLPERGDPRLGLGGVEGLFHRHRMHPLQSWGF